MFLHYILNEGYHSRAWLWTAYKVIETHFLGDYSMSKQVAQVVLPTIKDYRRERDALFADLKRMKPADQGSDAYNDIRRKIYDLDAVNAEHIDEGCAVTAAGLDFNKIRHAFDKVPNLPGDIRNALHDEFQQLLSGAAGEIARVAFRKSAEYANKTYQTLQRFREAHPELIEAIDEFGISVSLSVVTLHYDGFYGRAEGLTRLLTEQSEHFQFNRHSIRWIIANTGPKSVDIALNGELFTSAFSAGVSFHTPNALMVAMVDEALAHVGVPE